MCYKLLLESLPEGLLVIKPFVVTKPSKETIFMCLDLPCVIFRLNMKAKDELKLCTLLISSL